MSEQRIAENRGEEEHRLEEKHKEEESIGTHLSYYSNSILIMISTV